MWPEPYLQPDRTLDCGFYAAAYLARCLGHPEVTAGQVKAWRAQTRRHEAYFASDALGHEVRRFWDYRRPYDQDDMTAAQRIFWLGKGPYPSAGQCAAKFWVALWLANGWIAHAAVHRIAALQHAVVVLGASDDGVLLMDPIHGHVTEPWDWFLGLGPGHGAHFIEGWYRRGEQAQGPPQEAPQAVPGAGLPALPLPR